MVYGQSLPRPQAWTFQPVQDGVKGHQGAGPQYDSRNYHHTRPSHPYVSDEDRVLALLSSSTACSSPPQQYQQYQDSSRRLPPPASMVAPSYSSPGQPMARGNWYAGGSPYSHLNGMGAVDHRQHQAQQASLVDLDVYHHQLQSQQQQANVGHKWSSDNPSQFRPFDQDVSEETYATARADVNHVRADGSLMHNFGDDMYGDDDEEEYDGQQRLRGASLGVGLGLRMTGNEMEYHSQHYPSPIPGYYGNHTYQESQRQQEQGQQIYMSKAVEQAHGASAAYDYEAYYPSVQETQQFEKHQQQQQHLQAPEEPAPIVTSGVGLSGWLAEAVWELCTVPFAPTVRAGDAIEEEPYNQYSAYSSPDLVAYRELHDSHLSSTYASPVVGSGSPAMTRHNPFALTNKPSQGFHDFVHRTLSQTLLSPTAVVLSLWYIRRMAIHTGGGSNGSQLRHALRIAAQTGRLGGEDAVQRVLTLGLACSNKWLDDNTFTNKSWSDVTHLELREINRLELLALGPLKFDLSVNVNEWAEWIATVDRGVTPFVTDGTAVSSAVQSMHRALENGNAKFDQEIVMRGRHLNPLSPASMPSMAQHQVVLPPLSSVVADSVSPAALSEYHYSTQQRSQAYGYTQHGYHGGNGAYHGGYDGHQPTHVAPVPPAASSLPPPAMAAAQQQSRVSGDVFFPRSRPNQQAREQPQRNAYTRPSYGSDQVSYSGHQYYLAQLASHQPRFVSVLA